MDNIDGLITKDNVYRIISGHKMYIGEAVAQAMGAIVRDMPNVEAAPIKHGWWVPHKITASSKCSECRRVFADETPYCPNCGARMESDKE